MKFLFGFIYCHLLFRDFIIFWPAWIGIAYSVFKEWLSWKSTLSYRSVLDLKGGYPTKRSTLGIPCITITTTISWINNLYSKYQEGGGPKQHKLFKEEKGNSKERVAHKHVHFKVDLSIIIYFSILLFKLIQRMPGVTYRWRRLTKTWQPLMILTCSRKEASKDFWETARIIMCKTSSIQVISWLVSKNAMRAFMSPAAMFCLHIPKNLVEQRMCRVGKINDSECLV